VDLLVGGKTCASCVGRVEKKLNRLDGVEATVNLATASAHVAYPAGTPLDDLVRAVESAGYTASPAVPGEERADEERDHAAELLRRLLLAAPLTAAVLVLAMAPGVPRLPWLQLVLAVPVVLGAGWTFHRAAAVNARHGASTMDTLVSLGTLAATGWSIVQLLRGGEHLYFEVAATVTTFLLLGRWSEARAKSRAGSALRALLELGAHEAVVLEDRDGTLVEREVDVAELRPGMRVLVRPGAQVPTDAVVLEGRSSLDESMVIGESLPVDRAPGDELVGGTLNLDGRLVAEVRRVGGDTVLARLAAMVARAQSGKAPAQRLADRISAVFVPVVLGVALLTLLGWLLTGHPAYSAVEAAVAVLVIACPCALGLATPTALLVGTGRAAQLGIVIRDPAVLEATRRIDTVVLDKTGTLTTGVMAVHAAEGTDEALALAAAVEAGSEHPIGRAIAAYVEPAGPVTDFRNLPGTGVEGTVEGHSVRVARTADVPERYAGLVERSRDAGWTTVQVEVDGAVAAVLALGDTVKERSASAIAALHDLGLQTVLLTGDHEQAARHVARQVGLDDVVADVRPEDKARAVADLQADGRVVAMVGDGVNDAAALAQADLGVAMGTGTAVAVEAGQVILMNGDPGLVADAVALSRRTVRTIRQNLFWAFAYNVVGIPLAALGLLNPMIAGAAMAASSVCVVGNSLRLRGFGR
jgi:Cu+-exporting ATPase